MQVAGLRNLGAQEPEQDRGGQDCLECFLIARLLEIFSTQSPAMIML